MDDVVSERTRSCCFAFNTKILQASLRQNSLILLIRLISFSFKKLQLFLVILFIILSVMTSLTDCSVERLMSFLKLDSHMFLFLHVPFGVPRVVVKATLSLGPCRDAFQKNMNFRIPVNSVKFQKYTQAIQRRS